MARLLGARTVILTEYIIETPDMVATGRDVTALLLAHIDASWEKIQPEFVAVLRKLQRMETRDVIDAFMQLAIQEGRQALYAEIGLLHPDMNLAIPDDFISAATSRRKRKPTREKERTEDEFMEILREWANWWEGGWTQTEFADFKQWGSRSPLTDALRWFKDTYGVDFIKGNNRKQKRRYNRSMSKGGC